ncbi:3'-5' exonuclease domain [Macleaya cordata]|uniref:3'-5' exonuclease domain n=1 Tax=Macleaya cordata TaxID=56857 RepID=A0A200QBM5_MACCD|nr:3'-5' exonuclease domain [Macleaya cordata]
MSSTAAAAANYEIKFNGINIMTTVANASWMITSFLNELRSSFSVSNTTNVSPVVGLDVEWKPNYSTYDDNKVATLQLCHGNRCIIIQLLHLDLIPHSLKSFLADHSISFVGVGITDDLAKLRRDYGLECGSGLELGSLADKVYGKQQYSSSGLVELAREVLGFIIEKPESVTRTDWGAWSLTMEQIKYATVDAYASFAIGNKLLGGNN